MTKFEDLGFETRSYSGRGMFGQECLAITVGDPLIAIQEIAYETGAAATRQEEDGEEEVKMPTNIKMDSMGYEYVVYWPGVPFLQRGIASNERSAMNIKSVV